MQFERRAYARYDIQQDIKYIDPDTHREISSNVINISRGGICLYLFTPVRVGDEIIIKYGDQHLKKGVVAWFSKIPESLDIYKVGLKFL